MTQSEYVTTDVLASMVTISWGKWLIVTHQRDVLILIGHEKKSPIIQDHTVDMLYTKKSMVKVILVIEIPVKTVIKRKEKQYV